MRVETNKKLAAEFFGRLSTNDLTGAFAMIGEDAVWWVSGGDLFPFFGTKTKAEFVKITSGILSVFPKGLTLAPNGLVVEGDAVAVEIEGHGITTKGRTYDNIYHFLLKFKNGKIVAAKEYMDTLYAKVTPGRRMMPTVFQAFRRRAHR
jgi:uncharacterized protein